jgi:hypothetical protein
MGVGYHLYRKNNIIRTIPWGMKTPGVVSRISTASNSQGWRFCHGDIQKLLLLLNVVAIAIAIAMVAVVTTAVGTAVIAVGVAVVDIVMTRHGGTGTFVTADTPTWNACRH